MSPIMTVVRIRNNFFRIWIRILRGGSLRIWIQIRTRLYWSFQIRIQILVGSIYYIFSTFFNFCRIFFWTVKCNVKWNFFCQELCLYDYIFLLISIILTVISDSDPDPVKPLFGSGFYWSGHCGEVAENIHHFCGPKVSTIVPIHTTDILIHLIFTSTIGNSFISSLIRGASRKLEKNTSRC